MRIFAFALAAIALVACANEPAPMVPAAGGPQRACKKDSDCIGQDQCQDGRCLHPNDLGPEPPI